MCLHAVTYENIPPEVIPRAVTYVYLSPQVSPHAMHVVIYVYKLPEVIQQILSWLIFQISRLFVARGFLKNTVVH